jgi:hypothetical protein
MLLGSFYKEEREGRKERRIEGERDKQREILSCEDSS